jgi:geranylgeranyl pyrophosphate synthase
MSQVISDLVEGEFQQIKTSPANARSFDYYILKTYNKTASLIANSCRAAALLGDHSSEMVELAMAYGQHVGLAFQVRVLRPVMTSCDANLH